MLDETLDGWAHLELAVRSHGVAMTKIDDVEKRLHTLEIYSKVALWGIGLAIAALGALW